MTDRDNKAKRRASITSVLALLILTTSLSQCNGENYGEFNSSIESLENEHDHDHDHGFDTGNLENEYEEEHVYDREHNVITDGYEDPSDFGVDESSVETSHEEEHIEETKTSDSSKKTDKKKDEIRKEV